MVSSLSLSVGCRKIGGFTVMMSSSEFMIRFGVNHTYRKIRVQQIVVIKKHAINIGAKNHLSIRFVMRRLFPPQKHIPTSIIDEINPLYGIFNFFRMKYSINVAIIENIVVNIDDL